ncbi:hypothetical protein UFOVP439_21 [uncultured Caudovirales phage]|uniref:Bacteriophage lambda, Stf, side tail fibre-repeat-2 n=1 Tax=uncultured Caudovirales phage TaxID=2100421 RepID=A0A6J5MAB3_9CAUD|nr:hypothetical protein UFOVP439_21 [uncultured Caudovirales phage]
MATTTPNFGWPVPTSTDLVKDGAVAIEGLGDAIDASLLDLKGGTTGQVLAKASGTDMDFSWVAQDDSNAIQNAIVDAKGDLIAATANDTPARLAVGANDTVLVAASGQATGLQWSGASTSWTPSIFNLTLGNGTLSGSYVKVGKLVHARLIVTFGSTTSVGGTFVIGAPTTANGMINANIIYEDTGVQAFSGTYEQIGSDIYLRAQNATTTYVSNTALSSTIPFTWGSGDKLIVAIMYEEA